MLHITVPGFEIKCRVAWATVRSFQAGASRLSANHKKASGIGACVQMRFADRAGERVHSVVVGELPASATNAAGTEAALQPLLDALRSAAFMARATQGVYRADRNLDNRPVYRET